MSYAQDRSTNYTDKVEALAVALERLAQSVRREGKVSKRFFNRGQTLHAQSAADVVHTLSWGFANLNLQGLLTAASDADAAIILSAEDALSQAGVFDDPDKEVVGGYLSEPTTFGQIQKDLRGEK